MRKFLTVLKFELTNYVQNKSYMITSLLIAILVAVIMFLPRFVDMSGLLGIDTKPGSQTEQNQDNDREDTITYVIYDKSGTFSQLTMLEETFPDSAWTAVDSEKEVKQMVEDQDAEAGFVVHDLTNYEYYVYNKDLEDMDTYVFEELLAYNYRVDYCMEHNLDVQEVLSLVDVPIQGQEQILGKNMSDNYGYCYMLVIAIFMIIIIYCIMIATSVTNEKSNRSIEVLVTSTTPNSLIFGKVMAGTIASFMQVGLILLVALGGYSLNKEFWGGALDGFLRIPANVLVVFALFAVCGFIFYAFIYAAVGALCSKTEDINKSAGSVQMIIMIVYFAVIFQMYNIDGTLMRVLSFLPLSSYSAMYIRVAMGEVATWEVITSFLILAASTVVVGMTAAKIYRMGTLRYGNPISIPAALKDLRQKNSQK